MSRSAEARDSTGSRGRPEGLPKRWSAWRKAEVVLRLPGGEDIGEVSREIRVAPPELERWRREVLEGDRQGLKGRNRRWRVDSGRRSSTTPAHTTRWRVWNGWLVSQASTCRTSNHGVPARPGPGSRPEDYPEHARAAVREMHRQVGPLALDADGLATRGLVIRHLVMPGMLEERRSILGWIAREPGPDAYVNLMDRYCPAGSVSTSHYGEINRRLDGSEFARAKTPARGLASPDWTSAARARHCGPADGSRDGGIPGPRTYSHPRTTDPRAAGRPSSRP